MKHLSMTHVALLLVSIVIGYYQYHGSVQHYGTIKHQQVYDICHRARLHNDHETEQQCGDAQDKERVEYLCEHADNNPSTRCWIEEK